MSRLLRTAREFFRPGSPHSLSSCSRWDSPQNTSGLVRQSYSTHGTCTANLGEVASQEIQISTNPSPLGKSFYRRQLPMSLTSFTSYEGRKLFKEALNDGMVENYFSLVGNFTTQTETSYCGLGSLAMVLNAMEVDPGQTWKGVWRWYSDEMLECCAPLDLVKEKGITLDQFVCLAKCHGLEARSQRFDHTTYDQFKADLYKTATEPGHHMVISFNRASLGQTGIGHFSPIGAYHVEKGLCLVLDVARFKYPSYWAPIEMLW